MESVILDEIKKRILSESEGEKMEIYHVTCEGEPVDSCKTQEQAEDIVNKLEKEHPGKQFIIEKSIYESHSDMIEKLDEMGEDLEETKNMKTKETHEGNAFTNALNKAKEAGEETFTVDGKEYDMEESWSQMEEEGECMECGDGYMEEELTGNQDKIDANDNDKIDAEDFELLRKGEVNEETCEECGKEICECGSGMYESKKQTLRLTESELIKLITKMVNEAAIPGLETQKKVRAASGKENAENLAMVDKKIKDSLSFDGNENPEFPHQNKKGEKMAINNTDEENEFVENNRGGGMENLKYDHEPSKKFKERIKKALEGDSTMGNSQDSPTAIKSDLGKKIAKQAEKEAKYKSEAPMYNKDAQPVKTVNESNEPKLSILEEEIKKMKRMTQYNEKTQ